MMQTLREAGGREIKAATIPNTTFTYFFQEQKLATSYREVPAKLHGYFCRLPTTQK